LKLLVDHEAFESVETYRLATRLRISHEEAVGIVAKLWMYGAKHWALDDALSYPTGEEILEAAAPSKLEEGCSVLGALVGCGYLVEKAFASSTSALLRWYSICGIAEMTARERRLRVKREREAARKAAKKGGK